MAAYLPVIFLYVLHIIFSWYRKRIDGPICPGLLNLAPSFERPPAVPHMNTYIYLHSLHLTTRLSVLRPLTYNDVLLKHNTLLEKAHIKKD